MSHVKLSCFCQLVNYVNSLHRIVSHVYSTVQRMTGKYFCVIRQWAKRISDAVDVVINSGESTEMQD